MAGEPPPAPAPAPKPKAPAASPEPETAAPPVPRTAATAGPGPETRPARDAAETRTGPQHAAGGHLAQLHAGETLGERLRRLRNH